MYSHLSSSCHIQASRVLPSLPVAPEISFKTSRVLQAHAAAAQASSPRQTRARNSCFHCGATSYRSVVERDSTGTMRSSGRYQCVQCRRVFTDIRQWREGLCK
ncbi:MAG: hypothetical protein RLZZ612_1892 [Pseudomonadota bacterium]|jgi:transposase-like protein